MMGTLACDPENVKQHVQMHSFARLEANFNLCIDYSVALNNPLHSSKVHIKLVSYTRDKTRFKIW